MTDKIYEKKMNFSDAFYELAVEIGDQEEVLIAMFSFIAAYMEAQIECGSVSKELAKRFISEHFSTINELIDEACIFSYE